MPQTEIVLNILSHHMPHFDSLERWQELPHHWP
jgi:hypothetical protein